MTRVWCIMITDVQLWSTMIHHVCYEANDPSDVDACVCCARPLLVLDPGTRKMTFCPSFVQMMQKCTVDPEGLLYNEQCRQLREGSKRGCVYICYICIPSWKKSLMQFDKKIKVDLPSLFMENSYSLIRECNDKTDKLSLIKFILCVMSTIRIRSNNKLMYHPLRNSQFPVLEASILFFDYIFKKFQYNVREFSKVRCCFQMVSVSRWHVSGFPIVMQQSRHTQDLRKALRGDIGKLYREMWGFEHDFEEIQTGSREILECAACAHELHTRSTVVVIGEESSIESNAMCTSHRHVCISPTPSPGEVQEMTPVVLAIEPGAVVSTPSAAAPEMPAGSVHAVGRGTPKRGKLISYDMCFVDKWAKIWDKISHTKRVHIDDDKGIFANSKVICLRHFQTSVISYAFYKGISARFPVSMRERNKRRYYYRLLRVAS